MDLIYALHVVLMGIVEGLTEFLPVSSTGHLIVTAGLLDFEPPDKEVFIVGIQAGAILAVCWYYRNRIIRILKSFWKPGKEQRLAVNTVTAFVPAVIAGVLLADFIQETLFNSMTVGITLIAGGFVILWVEKRAAAGKTPFRVQEMDDLNWKDALGVGLMQCLAMIPGMSRSGSTIIGGMLLGLSRRAATEFSFFLGIPTILGATAYDVLKMLLHGGVELNVPALLAGGAVSFAAALAVVNWLLKFVSQNSFTGFGWYRIVFGALVLALYAAGAIA